MDLPEHDLHAVLQCNLRNRVLQSTSKVKTVTKTEQISLRTDRLAVHVDGAGLKETIKWLDDFLQADEGLVQFCF